jgi:hypothetical protein
MPTAAPALAPLTNQELQQLAIEWYRKLDVHAPLVEVLPLLATEGLEMVFPEATLHGQAEFEGWYERVIRVFFDEVHTVKSVTSQTKGDGAEVKVVVRWEASAWNPPAAKSQRIKLDAYQTWFVIRCPETQRPLVQRYVVDKLDFDADSARL